VSRTLLRNGVVRTDDTVHTAFAVEDGLVVWVGDEDRAAAYDGADEVVDLEGRFVSPAFVDAHVHTVRTGEKLIGLDLTDSTGRDEVLDRLWAHVALRGAGDAVIGTGWDETTWTDPAVPTADDLERVAPGRPVYLSRVDGHSAVVSHAMLARVPEAAGLDGFADHGFLQRAAKHAVMDRLADLVGPDQRGSDARAAIAEMARLGIGAFHENAAPHIGPEYELDLVRRAAAQIGLHATLYWGELGAVEKIAALGVAGLAGDLNADGAVGSRTAALRTEYADAPGHCGHEYLTAEQVADHVVVCTELGVQAGFHCIGDAALDAVTEGFRSAAEKVGADVVRGQRHRLEHCEMPSSATLAMMAELGVTASVQPMFDGLWGGPDRMYAARLGERWRTLNPFADLSSAGVTLAFGSDSPVTPLEPWGAVRAAVHHGTEGQGLRPDEAFRAHTSGGWRAARIDHAGRLLPGQRATYAVWEIPAGLVDGLPDLTPGADLPTCVRTVVDGRTVFTLEGVL